MSASQDGPSSDEFSTINPSFLDSSSPECSNQAYASSKPVHGLYTAQDKSYVNMLNNKSRRDSFPHGFADAPVGDAMAMSGLYFLGHEDITKCYCCGKVQNNWRDGKNVMDQNLHEENCAHFHSKQWPATPFGNTTPTQLYTEEPKEVPMCHVPSLKNFFQGIINTGKSLLQDFLPQGGGSQTMPDSPTGVNANLNMQQNMPGYSGWDSHQDSSDGELSDSVDIYGPGNPDTQ